MATGQMGKKKDRYVEGGGRAVQQRDYLTDKYTYESASDDGEGSYKDTEGIIRKTGRQGAKYEDRNKKKKKAPIKSQRVKSKKDTSKKDNAKYKVKKKGFKDSSGLTFPQAMAKARKSGKKIFTWDGRKYKS
jgi:hypothetical protein